MQQLIDLFDQHGPLLVFINILLEQLGVPLPAIPGLLVAGALSADGRLYWPTVLILAVLASGMANFVWFLAGRRFGIRILALMCRISISPDSCVSRTSNAFTRWGAASLLVARFIPGLSSVASPLAGAMGLPAGRFVLFDTLGTTIWAGSAIAAGALLHRQVDAVITALESIGSLALLVIVSLFALYITYRWLERQTLLRFVRKHRIDVVELRRLFDKGQAPLIVDVRSASLREGDPRRIPGALEMELEEVRHMLADVPKDREIVFYCSCPNEASAAKATRLLQQQGYTKVRPLIGGLDAWLAEHPQADAANDDGQPLNHPA
ncbi:DedA family protein/thiosulfate sulfurtransferase GlpE [Chitinimonas sp.]|uniref:DedA family protein/thiosulfate sulfurtransferase GlpE n=1 Tax=Chitinimonas sp. TaxID=1934313 RepID=UPI002F95EA98